MNRNRNIALRPEGADRGPIDQLRIDQLRTEQLALLALRISTHASGIQAADALALASVATAGGDAWSARARQQLPDR